MTTPEPPYDRSRALMTAQEVADETTLSVDTLYTWRSRGGKTGPKSFCLGRRIVYKRADVEAWLAAQEQATARGGEHK